VNLLCLRQGPKRARESGAVAVEFAILLPVLLVILFAIIEFGIAFSKFEVYVGAAREGARFAAVRCSPDATACTNALIASKVQSAAVGYPVGAAAGPGGTSPTANIVCSSSSLGQSVTVSWVQPIRISVPFWSDVLLTPTVRAAFRCE
jgi:Flp pilus assembly protein TadG